MSVDAEPAVSRAACASCLRRSWLLAQLAGPLDCNCRANDRLFDLLALSDDELIAALGGRRRCDLRERHTDFCADELAPARSTIAEICRHDPAYPRKLGGREGPAMLFVRGGLPRLVRLTARPVVAIVGTSRATDYGIELARSLARGLAVSEVTIAGELADGIGRGALEGALQAGEAALAALPGGVDVAAPARHRSLLERIARDGAVVSELPCGTPSRRWGTVGAQRIALALADVTIVVEAEDNARDLRAARFAERLGRPVAAVPGRVSSRASSGSNALLREGASLVRGPSDVLDLLHCAGGWPEDRRMERNGLRPQLREVLERVGEGLDTAEKLTGGAADAGELLQALSELELMGLLARGDGGRYVPRVAVEPAHVRYRSRRQMEP
jgi:DNA processing protein